MCKSVFVSTNCLRGRRIRSVFAVKRLTRRGRSIAWLREDGTYLVRPAYFFARWSNGVLRERMDCLYRVKKK